MSFTRTLLALLATITAAAARPAPHEPAPKPKPTELDRLSQAFAARTGATLVFSRGGLPDGAWFDRMPELDARSRLAAARILVAEAAKYPPGWLGAIGLHEVGVFAALVSDDGDGFRPYDQDWQGYLYYGLWNGQDAIAAAYYTDGQLPLTFHHEAFHHVDAAAGGAPHGGAFAGDDARFAAAIAGDRPYAALALGDDDLAALAARAGSPLVDAVSDYAAKSAGEDQAETARWLMSHLATGLWQASARPELAGSQRILHVLAEYGAAGSPAAPGPDAAWLVDLALGRVHAAPHALHKTVRKADNPYMAKVDAEIDDPAWRAAIRAVQPAAVKMGGGSGVNLAPSGVVLTAAHVVDAVGNTITVKFPDGSQYRGTCTHLDADLDLAVVELDGARGLPSAPVAAAAPAVGDDVAVIGQPGAYTPEGKPTHYDAWHVSTGTIRGFRKGSRTGEQHLGRTKHDAWTYWGHSGSPLFSRTGAIVALHNSWDSQTAMRHAVTWEAIVQFLDDAGVDYRVATD